MMVADGYKTFKWTLPLLVMLVVAGCGIASSYRSASKQTLRDFSGRSDYVKKVGIVALLNTSVFRGDQVTYPFMTAFLDSLESSAANTLLVVPGRAQVAPFLWNPPRLANGDLDVFTLSRLARQEGMNAVISPVLMDIRVRSRDTGFWLFKDVAYSLQIQTAAAIYDAITGARLDLKILTDEVDIDEIDADRIKGGQEVQVDDLVEVAQEMGESLGDRMGDAIVASKWLASVISVNGETCLMTAGSDVGIEMGDRFSVLDGSSILTGLDGQRFIVPGPKIGEIVVKQTTARESAAAPDSGRPPPAGSILIPTR
jgi:hypothetical protein